jgi:hypothetical protein
MKSLVELLGRNSGPLQPRSSLYNPIECIRDARKTKENRRPEQRRERWTKMKKKSVRIIARQLIAALQEKRKKRKRGEENGKG